MITQPLVYFANNTDYTSVYASDATNPKDKQVVFVGDTHKIYTHGVEFNGNNTVYDDTALNARVSTAEDKISALETVSNNHITKD